MLRAVAFCTCAYLKFKLSGTVYGRGHKKLNIRNRNMLRITYIRFMITLQYNNARYNTTIHIVRT